jgi:hypothetical protein
LVIKSSGVHPGILVCSCSSFFVVFCVVIWISLFVPFLWPLHCLSFSLAIALSVL